MSRNLDKDSQSFFLQLRVAQKKHIRMVLNLILPNLSIGCIFLLSEQALYDNDP